MPSLPSYDWLWVFWWLLFAVLEGVGLFHEARRHTDNWTLTHFISVVIPIGIRAAFLAWLAWHFLIEHKVS